MVPVRQLGEVEVLQILAWHPTYREDVFSRWVADVPKATIEATCGNSLHVAEICAKGADKGAMVASLAHELGVDRNSVVAFGDRPNDLSLLRWAGTPYAMANAHPQVLAAGQRRAPANDSDGVAQVLEEMFDL